MTEPPTKECSICGEIKPLENFHKDSQKKDGRSSWCRPCSKYRSKLAETPMATIKQQIAVLVAATAGQGSAEPSFGRALGLEKTAVQGSAAGSAALVPEKASSPAEQPKQARQRKPLSAEQKAKRNARDRAKRQQAPS